MLILRHSAIEHYRKVEWGNDCYICDNKIIMSERIAKLLQYLEQSPKDCFLHHALALEYVKLGDEQHAREQFEINLTNDPTYVATYYHLGKLLERVGKPDEAIPIYEAGMAAAKKAGDMHAYNELQAAYEDLVY